MEIIKKLKHKVKPFYVRITVSMVRIIESFHDLYLCGSVLTRERPVNVEGATRYGPSWYWALNEIFKDAGFTEEDSFVDVGCGEGRVLAWFVDKNFPGQITGIEKDPYVAAIAKKWMKRHPNEKIRFIEGDAMEQSYKDYTIIYFARPFNEEFFKRLILRIESQLTHPIRFYYLVDFYSREFLTNRPGWKMLKRRPFWKKYGLFVYYAPQFYSIWSYTPSLYGEKE